MIRLCRVSLFLMIMIIIFQISVSAREVTHKTVRLDLNGQIINLITTGETLEEAFLEHDIIVSEKDTLSWPLNRKLQSHTTNNVNLRTAFYITVVLDYREEIELLVSYDARVGHVLEEINSMFNIEFHYLDGFLNDQLFSGETIFLLSTFEYKTETTEEVPYETEIIYNDNLYMDEENIIRDGILGEASITTEVTYLGGKEIEREVISSEIITEPVNKIIEKGTKDQL